MRLHSTYRHDLKLYSSDEGRVQMTAAAFAKSFLALDGDLTPILVSLVSRDHSATAMLDSSLVARDAMDTVKKQLQADLTAPAEERAAAGVVTRVGSYVSVPQEPLEKLQALRSHMVQLLQELAVLCVCWRGEEGGGGWGRVFFFPSGNKLTAFFY